MASIKIAPAKILSQRTHRVAGKLLETEHFFEVPKDYSSPSSGTIRLFARSVRKAPHPVTGSDDAHKSLPWMCYFQGGPGFPCGRPHSAPWAQPILDDGYQLLHIDPRGTGLSTPVTASTLQMRGYPDVQARYLHLYRADSIVRDAEAVRLALTADAEVKDDKKDADEEQKKWSIIGQSFGGFCAITYLSFYPAALREAFLLGGLQPLVRGPDEVYRRTWKKVVERNEAYYKKYPEDVDRVKEVLKYLARFGDGTIKLPSEGSLTRRRFMQMGIAFGGIGGLDTVHDIVMRAKNDIEMFGHITRGSLSAIEHSVDYDDNIIYAIMHEPIYCEGQAPNWSAQRMMSEFKQFDIEQEGPVYFTGEMVFPWMFEDFSELRKIQDVANRVAADDTWAPQFDLKQLAKNTVPVYAASYLEDMYVDSDLAMETARAIKGCKYFTTNVLFHDAIRSKTAEVMKQLFALRDDVVE